MSKVKQQAFNPSVFRVCVYICILSMEVGISN